MRSTSPDIEIISIVPSSSSTASSQHGRPMAQGRPVIRGGATRMVNVKEGPPIDLGALLGGGLRRGGEQGRIFVASTTTRIVNDVYNAKKYGRPIQNFAQPRSNSSTPAPMVVVARTGRPQLTPLLPELSPSSFLPTPPPMRPLPPVIVNQQIVRLAPKPQPPLPVVQAVHQPIAAFYARTQPHDFPTLYKSLPLVPVDYLWKCPLAHGAAGKKVKCDAMLDSNSAFVNHITAHYIQGEPKSTPLAIAAQAYRKLCQCDVCFTVFTAPQTMINHRRLVHDISMMAFEDNGMTEGDIVPSSSRLSCSSKPTVRLNGKEGTTVQLQTKTGMVVKEEERCGLVQGGSAEVLKRRQLDSKLSHTRICHICNRIFSGDVSLSLHMHSVHKRVDMPYNCAVCQFSSSLYDDVSYHVREVHRSHAILLCPTCLLVVRCPSANPSKNDMQQLIDEFASHMAKHSTRQLNCQQCRLTFVTNEARAQHIHMLHRVSHRVVPLTQVHNEKRVIRAMPMLNTHHPVTLASLEQSNRYTRTMEVSLPTLDTAICVECYRPMSFHRDEAIDYGTMRHYSHKNLSCALCKYTTRCKFAIDRHMNTHKTNVVDTLYKKGEIVLDKPWTCKCGYSTKFGNQLATHLVTCAKSDERAICAKEAAKEKPRVNTVNDALLAHLGLVRVGQRGASKRSGDEPDDQPPKRARLDSSELLHCLDDSISDAQARCKTPELVQAKPLLLSPLCIVKMQTPRGSLCDTIAQSSTVTVKSVAFLVPKEESRAAKETKAVIRAEGGDPWAAMKRAKMGKRNPECIVIDDDDVVMAGSSSHLYPSRSAAPAEYGSMKQTMRSKWTAGEGDTKKYVKEVLGQDACEKVVVRSKKGCPTMEAALKAVEEEGQAQGIIDLTNVDGRSADENRAEDYADFANKLGIQA